MTDVSVTNEQISVSVTGDDISATVSGGIGPSGPTGPQGPQGDGYTLPVATASVLGGVKIGSGISIDGSGVISASSGYTLPTATNSVLGGVKIGSGVTITDGVISVSTDYAAAVHATEHHPDGSDPLALVASTGNYNDLVDKPSLAAVATSGSYTDINGIPSLAQVATSGSYNDLANTPSLAQVATSGSYNDLSNTPTLGTAAGADIGTGAAEVAAGNHTHSQLHDRSHAITSTSDHTATAWRVFHSNGSGEVVELALGSAGQALLSNGTSAAPSWGSAGSNSASDLTQGTLAYARMADPTVTSPSQITASQNDYASFARGINRFSTNGAYNLTGMTAGNDGEVRVLTNVGTTAANTLTIKDQSASSTAANRFAVPWAGDCVIAAGASVVVFYDNTTQRWRIV